MAWGLFCTLPDATGMWLEQIAGDGRLFFRSGKGRWWGRAPAGALWSVYRTEQGQTYQSKEEAKAVAERLSALSAIAMETGTATAPQSDVVAKP